MEVRRDHVPEQDVKAFLRSAYEARLERVGCERLLFLLRQERAALERPCSNEKVLRPDRDALCRMLEGQERELTEQIADCCGRMRQVMKLIDTLPDRKQRAILFLRYVEAMEWPVLRETLEKEYALWYEERQIFRLHNAALRELQRRWEEQSGSNCAG